MSIATGTSIATGVLLVCVPGALGGLLYAIQQLVDKGKRNGGYEAATRGVPLWLFFLARGFMGLGGAAAVVMVLIMVGKYTDTPWQTSQWLFLIFLAFVSGFAGHRFLPGVAAKLEGQIQDLGKRTEDIGKDAEEIGKRTKEIGKRTEELQEELQRELAVAMGLLNLERAKVLPLEIDQDIKRLETASAKFPLSREVHIVLGRMYRWKRSSYKKAIEVLSEFLRNKEDAGQGGDKDAADALFNRACYYSMGSADVQPSEAAESRHLAFEDLGRSLRLSPENAKDANADPDFDPLRGDPRFQALLSG